MYRKHIGFINKLKNIKKSSKLYLLMYKYSRFIFFISYYEHIPFKIKKKSPSEQHTMLLNELVNDPVKLEYIQISGIVFVYIHV